MRQNFFWVGLYFPIRMNSSALKWYKFERRGSTMAYESIFTIIILWKILPLRPISLILIYFCGWSGHHHTSYTCVVVSATQVFKTYSIRKRGLAWRGSKMTNSWLSEDDGSVSPLLPLERRPGVCMKEQQCLQSG